MEIEKYTGKEIITELFHRLNIPASTSASTSANFDDETYNSLGVEDKMVINMQSIGRVQFEVYYETDVAFCFDDKGAMSKLLVIGLP